MDPEPAVSAGASIEPAAVQAALPVAGALERTRPVCRLTGDCNAPGFNPGRASDRLRPAGASRDHDTHRRHAMAPGLVGQTIERVAGNEDATGSANAGPGAA
jgi:hypothetical protein